jgi:hypothetical protein
MNKGVPPSDTEQASKASARIDSSDSVLTELLALNEEMAVQLRVERTDAKDAADFITGMILQHEKVAAKLRAHLRGARLGLPLSKPLTS